MVLLTCAILYIYTSMTTQLLQFNLAEASNLSSRNSKSGNMNHRHIGLTNRQKFATDCNGITNRRTLHLLPHKRTSTFMRRRRSGLLRKNARNTTRELAGKIRAGIKRLREEMAEISEEQKCIREGQRQVRNKFEKMEAEREQLRKETELISKQNAGIQVRLGLMSGIMKARAQNDFDLAAQLTHSLRDLLAKQDEQMN